MIMFMFTITVVKSPNSPGAGLTEEKIFYDTLKNLAIGPPPIKKTRRQGMAFLVDET